MSKALRRCLTETPSGTLPLEDSLNIVRSLLEIPNYHLISWSFSPPATKTKVALHNQPTKAAPLAGGLLLGKSNKKRWFQKPSSAWLTEEGLLAQTVLFGCVGAGRTYTLLTMAMNAAQAPKRLSGHSSQPSPKSVFYMDGKGDNSLYSNVVSGLSERQRIGDLRVINLLRGGRSDEDIERGDKLSHSLDLFAGFTQPMLHQWLLDMVPLDLRETQEWRAAAESHLSMVAFLAMAWSCQTQQRITPSTLGDLMISVGTEDLAQNLKGPSGHAARQWRDQVWGKVGQTEAAAFLKSYGQQIQRSFQPFEHVFESKTPEVGLCYLQDRKHAQRFVLVLAPAMERATDETRLVTRAIATSLRLSLEKRGRMNTCDTLVILDEFSLCLEPQDVAKLGQTRDRGAGIVWGAEDPKAGFGRNTALFNADWEPETHIMMKQEGCHYSDEYMSRQREKNPSFDLPGEEFFRDVFPGQAIVWNSYHKTEIMMDYSESPRPSALFLAHARPLPFSVPSPSNVAQLFLDETRMARVLKDRLETWSKEQPPTLSWCQETVARLLGFSNWHEAHEVLGQY